MAKRLLVHGRVQGVCYRAWSVEQARSLGLAGWVRNRRDGTVEMLVDGEAENVARMIDLCRQGPTSALVERIDVDDSAEPVPLGFEKRSTE